MPHPYFELPPPLVLGHRGAAGEMPENTLPSFERALARGAHVLESDVHVTRDGVPVLIHDPVVDRTTDGSGRVDDLSWEDLRRLDAGFRFSPDGGASHPFRGRGITVPSLEEAFDRLPGARFNLELKAQRPELVERAVALVRAKAREAVTLLTAGEDPIMARLRDELRRTGVACAVGASTGDILRFIRSAQDGKPPDGEAMALQIPTHFGGRPLITAELLGHAHAYGVFVHAWTINEEPEMERLLDLGVDGLVTDFPGRMAELLQRRAQG